MPTSARARARADDPELPEHLAAAAAPTFAGREAELALIGDRLEQAGRGMRQVVLVGGDAGMGKTALVSVAALRARRDGATILYGRCSDGEGVPYQPFVEALSRYVRHAPAQMLHEFTVRHGGEIRRLVPDIALRLPDCPQPRDADPETERYGTFFALVGLLVTASRQNAVVLVIDDVHWADRPTLQLLRYVCGSLEGANVTLIVAYRDSELFPDHPLSATLEHLGRQPGVARLGLKGLSEEDLGQVVAEAIEAPLPEARDAISVLHRETGGNPFFAKELLRHFEESASPSAESGPWWRDIDVGGTEIPRSIREIVLRRLARLGGDARDVLSLASVMGREFSLELLGPLTGLPESAVLELLEQSEHSSLVVESPTGLDEFTFTHALIRSAVYQDLTPYQRRTMHHAVAEARLTRHPDSDALAADIASHWLQSDQPENALPFARRAGQVAASMLAPDESIRWYSVALALLREHRAGELAERCDLLIDLGVAQKLAGDPGHRETLLEACRLADACDDPGRMADAALANYRGFWTSVGRVDQEKVAALERTIARQPEEDSGVLSELVAIYCNEITFDATVERRRELADRARQMAERIGDVPTLVRVLNTVFQPLVVAEYLPERLENAERAVACSRELGEPIALFTSLVYRMRACFEAGLISEAGLRLAELGSLAEELTHPYAKWIVDFTRATWALLLGDPDGAERIATEALDFGLQSGQPDAFTIYIACLHSIRWQQGRLAEIVDVIAQAVADNPGIRGYKAALARAKLDAGEPDRAREMLAEALASRFSDVPMDLIWSTTMVVYSEVAVRLDDADAAACLLDILSPWPDRMAYVTAAIDGPIATSLGSLATVVGRFDEAERWFAQAEEMNQNAGAAFFSARNQAEWGRMLRARGAPGDGERASRLTSEASRLAEAGGYRGVISRLA